MEAVESAFYEDVDYAVLQKVYGNDMDAARRYSPAKIVSSSMEVIKGVFTEVNAQPLVEEIAEHHARIGSGVPLPI